MTNKKVYVVLSRTKTTLSRIIRYVKKIDYTHAAISLDENLDYMYSFGRKYAFNPFLGCFKHERMDRGLYDFYDYLPGMIIELEVDEDQYETVISTIRAFLNNRKEYSYNLVGLVGSALNKPMKNDLRFFCSEFVYYVLNESGICDFNKPRGLVSPTDFLGLKGRVVYQGNLKDYFYERRFTNVGERLESIYNIEAMNEFKISY
ncbi:MAG: hypothetical protein GXZ08_05005 [Tissierellia bacterium]|nr:hypothetical protein [Tissierellia bacterium]